MRGEALSPAEVAGLIEDVLRDHVFQEGSLEKSISTFASHGDRVLYLPHGVQVLASDLCKELRSWRPQRVEGDIVVYHGTDRDMADFMLENGVIPQMKAWTLAAERYAAGGDAMYQPSEGLERGLYVTSLPSVAEGFGPIVLALSVPSRWIEISAEVASHGYNSGAEALDMALRSVDGAIIKRPIHPDMIEEYGR